MIARPIFLSRTTRRIITIKRFSLAASLAVGGFFMLGYLVGVLS